MGETKVIGKNGINLENMIFGRLRVLKCVGRTKYRSLKWLCICKCGTKRTIQSIDLIHGKTRSCGCLKKENNIKIHLKHGYARHGKRNSYYIAWRNMRGRCLNPNDFSYKNYGGRGIKICPEWDNFLVFLKDMGPRPTSKHSLDRYPNTNGNYEPSNCRWATSSQQISNRRKLLAIENFPNAVILAEVKRRGFVVMEQK